MRFSAFLVAGASIIPAIFAQTTPTIGFTQIPANVTAGVPTVIKWTASDPSQPVTLFLKEGSQGNLKTISILTGDATGGSYTWTPSSSLPDADDYSLEITQGESTINYSGTFSLTGGSSSSASSSSSSSSSSPTSTTASASGTAATVIIATVNNGTTIAGTTFATTIGTGASSAGTGTVMNRNTTFSSQTLGPTTGAGATTGSGSATTTATTTATASATPSTTGAANELMSSSFALVLCLFAAVAMWY